MRAESLRFRSSRLPTQALVQRLLRCCALLVLLVLPLQTSGLAHLVVAAVTDLGAPPASTEARPCSHEEDGEHCPPDCATCHCVPAVQALFPTTPSVLGQRVRFVPPPGTPPPASLSSVLPPSGLDRPPRLSPSFA